MKDAEQRQMFLELVDYCGKRFDDLERKITAASATIVGGEPKELQERMERIDKTLAAWNEGREQGENRLSRIQECVEAGRRFESKIELPSPRVPMFVGLLLGAFIFALGMFVGTFMK